VPAWDGTGPIPSAAKGKGRVTSNETPAPVVSSTGASVWEATPEKRMGSLQKRKEAMILAARQYVLFLIRVTPHSMSFQTTFGKGGGRC